MPNKYHYALLLSFLAFASSMAQPSYIDVTQESLQNPIVPNDNQDDSAGINELIRRNNGATLFFPAGLYILEEAIDLRYNKSILGERHNINSGTIWRVQLIDTSRVLNAAVFNARPRSGLSMKNIKIECQGQAQYGLKLDTVASSETYVENIIVTGALEAGFRFYDCEASNFSRLKAYQNPGDGFQIVDCNGSMFRSLQAEGNEGDGMLISNTSNTGSCFLSMGRIENNEGHGIVIRGGETTMLEHIILEKFWIENNGKDGVTLKLTRSTKIRDCKILGRGQTQDFVGIRLSNSKHCVIDGNFVAGGTPQTYRCLTIANDSPNNIATGNTRIIRGNSYEPLPICHIVPMRRSY